MASFRSCTRMSPSLIRPLSASRLAYSPQYVKSLSSHVLQDLHALNPQKSRFISASARTWQSEKKEQLGTSAKSESLKSESPSTPEAPGVPKTPLESLSKGFKIKENIYTIPNFLTLTRLVSSPIIGYLVIQGQPFWALSLFTYSCVTDLLDGWIARRYNMQSVVGSVIDPIADKALMVTLASCLAVSGDIPIYMAVLILGRDGLLGLSAFYYRYISLPPPMTFTRYWDFSIPSAEVHPTTISKYNTFLQMVYLGSSLVYPVIKDSLVLSTADLLSTGLTALGYVVATTTVWSGLSYVFSKEAVRLVRRR